MVELLGLLACICAAAYGAGSVFGKELQLGRNIMFSVLVSILVGLTLLLVYALTLYGGLFVLRGVF